MKILKLIFVIAFLAIWTNNIIAQTSKECLEEMEFFNIAPESKVLQSSTDEKHKIEWSIDKKIDEKYYSLTKKEKTPWWEAQFKRSFILKEIKIWYPKEIYKEKEFKNYYILMSQHPFSSTDLKEELSSPLVHHIYVKEKLPSGFSIPLEYQQAQYVRIQLEDEGFLAFVEVEIPGGGDEEICGNGEDDDCDGLVDCEDSDCMPSISNASFTNPTCQACNNGSISIQVSGDNITINGESCNGICITDNLDEGDYEFVVSNGFCDTELSFTLTAPIGGDESDCANGGFEDGDFSNWITSQGTFATGDLFDIEEVDNPMENPGFSIIQSGNFNDPNMDGLFPQGTVNSPTNGTFIAILGEEAGNNIFNTDGNDFFQMSNCFEVTSQNSNFAFNYALVLADPNHPENEQPFFEWSITVEETGEKIDGEKITSGVSFFDESTNRNSLKGWTCESADLSEFVGQKVCVEFILVECGTATGGFFGNKPNGNHGGYAYIDAICQTASENAPDCDFTLESMGVCEAQGVNVIFDAGINNFDRFTINICDENGDNCTDNISQDGFNIENINILDFANQGGLDLQHGKTYSVQITLNNNCGSCSQTQNFIYYDLEMILDYPDILVVCGNPSHITIPGNSTCSDCIYEWSPTLFLEDNTVQNPTIDGTFNLNAFNQSYTITATKNIPDGNTCIATKTVEVVTPTFDLVSDSELTYCAIDLNSTINAPFPIQPSDFSFKYIDEANDKEHPVQGINIDEFTIQFMTSISRDEQNDLSILSVFEFLGNDKIIPVGQICEFTNEIGDFPNGIFSRNWNLYISNDIYPESTAGVGNEQFHPFIVSEDSEDPCITTPSSSVYYLKLDIFDRWGGLVFTEEESIPITNYSGLHGDEVSWDGKYIDEFGITQTHQQGVYVWVLTLKSCTDIQGDLCSPPTNPDPCNAEQGEYCSITSIGSGEQVISGDVTLVK